MQAVDKSNKLYKDFYECTSPNMIREVRLDGDNTLVKLNSMAGQNIGPKESNVMFDAIEQALLKSLNTMTKFGDRKTSIEYLSVPYNATIFNAVEYTGNHDDTITITLSALEKTEHGDLKWMTWFWVEVHGIKSIPWNSERIKTIHDPRQEKNSPCPVIKFKIDGIDADKWQP